MISVECYKGKKVALFGLGKSGLATAQALISGGAEVIAWDDNPAGVEAACKENIATRDLHHEDWSEFVALILAPGVPLFYPKPHWVVDKARQENVEVIGDIELFVRARNHFLQQYDFCDWDVPFIAITGTNGKSTTTTLLVHLLEQMGYDVQMGGNVGTAILTLKPFVKKRIYVIECSSFQIDLAPSLQPTIGILLNLTPDHIDRHGTFAHYAQVKGLLVSRASHALISVDDAACKTLYQQLVDEKHQVEAISKKHFVENGFYVEGTQLFSVRHRQRHMLVDLAAVTSLRGSHNAQNALMVLATLQALKITDPHLERHLVSYAGLAHRMQQVRKIGSVLFINDSKATNADASAVALATFDDIFWILGGKAKEGGIDALRKFFPKIRKAYLIGEAAEDFVRVIGSSFPISMSLTLENAVREAAIDASHEKVKEAVVLLSPACASYDQFKDYEMRGEAFISFVMQLNKHEL
ncbi:UDP-N-acetylmuramoylalanine-D-glutamate ligase [Bartonella bacilliformis str. Heidi Mejia]|uniref:UDP-N-acetylmuramoyl-L-alanine--D-glutamate ligase n=1 Tax=Bartonella bacilliformis TaxID=774 RepID=UPI00044B652B|nr:UDP-N-acetylmuramoyl-L-alanine--D-glutamate ligase [Bartonella bacilliformis]EYS92621.1 UDP-N-acetylmuramoylalanine-D-glutamate ligase [Bartonella bacilliformis str. Heidi Mejia]KEG19088.1 UDP-N-acetylmuramoylalanine-D-glutamate ligase [Bartonella bacilliformis Hosp800-02]KEG22289.1 UDP-N-acetylmuramoylalanine-D-glutamate ligase [Bartonella bacilliformis VAB9028]KEG24545.1 UDP-N-acetylmuramoylalanine-D-glutamate ligase [Bartonella bacilliformis CAR600-02]